VLQAFLETLHWNLPQKIHIRLCGGVNNAEPLDASAPVRLVSMKWNRRSSEAR
jgi:hypothetical protein